MTTRAHDVQEPFERRALLLHLGDALETMFCLAQCADDYPSIAEALKSNDALADFPLLASVDAKMTPHDFIRRASSAFFVWPKALLDETLNRPMLASTVRHDLFEDNAKGWHAYVEERRKEVAWFGKDVPESVPSSTRAKAPAAGPEREAEPSIGDADKDAPPAPAAGGDKPDTSGEGSKSSRYATWPWPDKPGGT